MDAQTKEEKHETLVCFEPSRQIVFWPRHYTFFDMERKTEEMFSNQISSKDLYSANDNLDKGYSAERDFSQLQNAQFTQFDNSQYSQDFFSQTQGSSGSAESQGRKFQPFEKYMAKPSLFRGNSQGRGPQNRQGTSTSQLSSREPQQAMRQQVSSFQQQININKNKAKERDERDMLSSIVHIVKECSDEVKQSLNVLRDGESENNDKLKTTLVSLTDQIRESSDKILKSVQSREEQVSIVERLQRQLLEKEERIQELLKHQNSNSTQENPKSLVEAMKTFMTDQQNETDKRLQKLLEATQEELKLLKDQTSAQRNSSDENNKNFQDMKYSTNRQIQDVEKRVVDELLHIRDDFERQKRDMESFYKNQLQTQQQKQTREITQHLDRGLENISKPATDFDLLERQTDIVTEVCKKQQNDLVSAVKTVVNDQSKLYLHQNQRDLNVLQHNIVNDLDRKIEYLKTAKESDIQIITDQIDKSIEHRSASWKNDLVPKKVQAQLDELHSQHMSEIQKLEKQIEEQKKNAEEVAKSKMDLQPPMAESALQNIYDLNAEERRQTESKTKPPGSLFQRASGFISPRPPVGTTWNSRAIFGRTNPSPVATVLPQRHTATKDSGSSGSNVVSHIPQQNSRMQQTVVARIQLPRQAAAPDHVVPATPESAREIVEHSMASVTDTEILQETYEENSQQLQSPQSQAKTTPRKAVPKKKGNKKKKKRVYTKKPKAKLKSYQKHQKITKTQDTVVTSTKALAVYDFGDEFSPQPLIRKSNIMKQINPIPNSDSRIVASSNLSSASDRLCVENDSSQSDTSSQDSTPALPHIDVFMKRKVGQTERISPMKQEKQFDVESQGLMCQHDFLSTPNLTAQKTVPSDTTNVYKAVKSEGINKNVRRFEPKRKLCDFDYQIVNLLECVQKKRKINA